MPSLHEVQRTVLDAIAGDGDAAARFVCGNGLDPHRRLAVYRNNMLANLTGALLAVYPVIERLVGAGFFDYATRHYIAAHPSRNGDIHRYGAAFGSFLAGFGPAQDLPYLADVAALEWAYHEVFHAEDAGGLQLEQLACVAQHHQGALRLALNPACRLLESPYPVLYIWQANQPGAAEDGTIDLDAGGDRILVLRRRDHVEFQRLGEGSFVWLKALDTGASLGAASTQAIARDTEFDLARELHRHVSQQTLTGLRQPPDTGPNRNDGK